MAHKTTPQHLSSRAPATATATTVAGVDAEAAELRQKSKESLDKSLALARESLSVGTGTLLTLDEQEEKIRGISGKVDEIDANLTYSDRVLRRMQGIGSSLKGLVVSPRDEREGQKRAKERLEELERKRAADAKAAAAAGQGSRPSPVASPAHTPIGRQRSPVAAAAPAPATAIRAMEDPVEDAKLDELAGMLRSLKQVAKSQGDAIGRHNDMLDTLNVKVDNTADHLQRVTAKTHAIERKNRGLFF